MVIQTSFNAHQYMFEVCFAFMGSGFEFFWSGDVKCALTQKPAGLQQAVLVFQERREASKASRNVLPSHLGSWFHPDGSAGRQHLPATVAVIENAQCSQDRAVSKTR